MRALTISLILIFSASCGQENFMNSVTEISEQIKIDEETIKEELENIGETYYYDEIVTYDNNSPESNNNTGNNEISNNEPSDSEESSSSQEEEESSTEEGDDSSQESDNIKVAISGSIYRSKQGEIIYKNSQGEVLNINSITPEAELILEKLEFPNDSYEVNLTGHYGITSTKFILGNNLSNLNKSIVKYFNIDEIELKDKTTHPERELFENTYSLVICGLIQKEQLGGDKYSIIIFDYINENNYTDNSFQITYDFSITNPQDLSTYLEFVSEYNHGDLGCIYSNKDYFNDYSISSRKLIKLQEYDLGW